MISEAPSEDGSMNVIEDICDLVAEKNEDVRCMSVVADYWENSLLRPSMVPSLSSDLLVMQKFTRAAPSESSPVKGRKRCIDKHRIGDTQSKYPESESICAKDIPAYWFRFYDAMGINVQ
jgi:hypothetical protein